jgi:hypothetical protein
MSKIVARLCLAAVLGFLSVCLFPRPSARGAVLEASTALALDTQALVDGADLILEGHVEAARAVLQPDGTIDTEYDLAVERTLLGEDLPTRRLRLPGGVLPDGRGMLLPGIEHPPIGARLLWFLSAEGQAGRRMPIGLCQGLWRVLPAASGGSLAVRGGAGVALLDPAGGGNSGGSHLVRPHAELLAEVHAALAVRAARPGAGR